VVLKEEYFNVHHYEEIFGNPDGQQERFLALWEQIADHYQEYPPELLFEILNEPQGRLSASKWNQVLVAALAVIRETNPTRNVIIGPAQWNGIAGLDTLQLPAEDRHIIATVHYYEPFEFTHQGAEWVSGSDAWLGVTWRDTRGQKAALSVDLEMAAAWAEANSRPLYLGEFGAYGRADIESRALWTASVARQAEERGMSWAYWDFCAGFGVYDAQQGEWNEALRKALLPPPQESGG
jgi:endoglucanase